MKPLRNVLVAALCVASVNGSVRAENLKGAKKPKGRDRISRFLETVRQRYRLPAIAAAVVSSKGVERIEAVGVRKRGGNVAVTKNDRFHLGSNGKALTAAMIGKLIDEGKLSWDLTLAKAFPELARSMAANVGGITLKHLLTHTSGLQGDPKVGWMMFERGGPIRQRRSRVVRWAVKQKLDFQPGTGFQYSNLGYTIAAAVAERKLKQSWERLIQTKLFTPLKMTSSGFGPPGSARKTDQPWPHTEKGEPLVPDLSADNPPVLSPAGRIHCSLSDWSKFLADQLKGAQGRPGMLKPETYRRLQSSTVGGIDYTVGAWDRGRTRRGVVLSHDGSNTVNYSTAVMLPDSDAAVVVVCNQGGEAAQKACDEVLRMLLRRQRPKR